MWNKLSLIAAVAVFAVALAANPAEHATEVSVATPQEVIASNPTAPSAHATAQTPGASAIATAATGAANTTQQQEANPKARSDFGTTVQWFVFGIFTLSSVVFASWGSNATASTKKFYYLTAGVTLTAALSYLSMAAGSFVGVSNGREFAPARYADWLFTTPLLLIDLGLLAGIAYWDIAAMVGLDVLMIIAGVAAAYSTSETARWGLYVFSCVVMAPVIYAVVTSLRESAHLKGEKVAARLNSLAYLTAVTWIVYPIVWYMGEGTQNLSVDHEIFTYAILDVTAKAGFGFILLSNHKDLHEGDREALHGDYHAAH